MPDAPSQVLELQGCVVHLALQRVVTHDGAHRRLTTREAELLRYMSERPSVDVSREELLTEVWGYPPDLLSRATDNAMNRLREKVELDPANPVHLLTVHGVGYRFEPVAPELEVPVAVEAVGRVLELHDRRVDLTRRRIHHAGEEVPLTTVEAALLEQLAERAGRDVAREDLLASVWGIRGRNSRVLDTTIRRLRAKLEADPGAPRVLHTSRGRGYRLEIAAPLPVGELTLVHLALHHRLQLRSTAPALAALAVTVQEQVLAPLVATHGGSRVRADEDAWRLAFPTPQRALEWCVAAQRVLLEAPWSRDLLRHPGCGAVPTEGGLLWRGPRVDMGVVAGRPEVVLDPLSGVPSYRGPVVARADWLLARCAPGQTLVSADVWERAGGAPGAFAVPVDLSDGLGRTVAVIPEGLEGRTSGWALDLDLPSLPTFARPLGGRSLELETLDKRLRAGARLLTLLGPGGIGKTRLAAALAERASLRFDAVGWVSATGARTADDVARALALALGVAADARGAAAVLARRIRRPTLLVLDELEGAASTVGPLLEALLDAAPALVIVATSRHRLGLLSEHPFEVGPLDADAARALLCQVSGEPAAPEPALDAIAARVDAVPLALELAGARARLLGIRAVAARLDEDLGLLRAAHTRDRRTSLAASIEASWSLLAPWERAAAAQLSVFATPFTAEAAEAVLDLPTDAPASLDVLEALSRCSLLTVARGEDGPVLRLYAVVRELLADKLDDREAVLRRYVSFYAGYGEARFLERLDSPAAAVARSELIRSRPHLEAALEQALTWGRTDLALRLARAHHEVIQRHCPPDAGLRTVQRLLTLPDLSDRDRGWLHVRRARHLRNLTRWSDAIEHAREGSRLALAAGDLDEAVFATLTEAVILFEQRRLEDAARAYARGERVARDAGRDALAWYARARMGELEPGAGPSPLDCLERAIAAGQREARPKLVSLARHAKGTRLLDREAFGEAATALEHAVEGLDAHDPAAAATARVHLFHALLGCDRIDGAAWQLAQAAAAYQRLGMSVGEAMVRVLLAGIELVRGADAAAAELLASALPLLHGSDVARTRSTAHLYLGQVHLDGGQPGEARRHLEAAKELAEACGTEALALQAEVLLVELDARQGAGDALGTLPHLLARADREPNLAAALLVRAGAARAAVAAGREAMAEGWRAELEAWPDAGRGQAWLVRYARRRAATR